MLVICMLIVRIGSQNKVVLFFSKAACNGIKILNQINLNIKIQSHTKLITLVNKNHNVLFICCLVVRLETSSSSDTITGAILVEKGCLIGWAPVSTQHQPFPFLLMATRVFSSLQYTPVCRSAPKTKRQWCDIAPPHRSFAVSSQCGHHMCGFSWEAKKREWGGTKQVLNPHAVLRLLFSCCN